MERVAIKPGRAQLHALVLGLCAVCIAMVILPAFCAPLSLLMPLLACPLVGRREEPLVYVAAAMPAVVSLMAGYETVYSLSLLTVGGFALLVTKLLPPKNRVGMQGILWYMMAVAASLVLIAACAARMLGGPLWQSLAELMADVISRHEQSALLLYRFAASGLISVPEGYAGNALLSQLFNPLVVRQMLLSFKLTIGNLLFDLLPSFFVQASMMVGLFTALRVQRMNGVILVVEAQTPAHKKARVAVPPGFRLLTLPPRARWPITLMAVAALFLLSAAAPVAQIVGQLCYTTFETVFMLVGAAVIVGVFSSKNPERKRLYGLLAALLYMMAPFILFLIGLSDQTFHYRTKRSGHPD